MSTRAFSPDRLSIGARQSVRRYLGTTSESDEFSRDLKQRGFSFVGSTVIYAHMQAVGMVNDHLVDCFRYRTIKRGLS
jgi:DNA-3-methyladenine glycosylase I